MGEVRTNVRLVNAADEEMARRGDLPENKVRSYETDALIDTGAVSTIIPDDVVVALGLEVSHRRVVEYADGRQEAVNAVGPISIIIRGRKTFEEALVLGDEVLIGQTVLEKLDLHVDLGNPQLIPNPAHPDQAVNKVK